MVLSRGFACLLADEQGTSGADLQKRVVTKRLLKYLKDGTIHGLAAYEVSRLTRDEFGIDGGTIARVLVETTGVLVTYGHTYDLRDDNDFTQFQFQAFMAGFDWRRIRNTFWSGIFKRAQKEVIIRRCPVGYKTKAMEMPGTNGRFRSIAVKDPDQFHAMDRLAYYLDNCQTLPSVAACLNREGITRPPSNWRGNTIERWTLSLLHSMLDNPLYYGVWTFGRTRESVVWHNFRQDQINLAVPELAYWTKERFDGWRRKYHRDGVPPVQPRPDIRVRKFNHPLLGLLYCPHCGKRCTSWTNNIYRCRTSRNEPGRCPKLVTIRENVALWLIEHQLLPSVMVEATQLADAVEQQLKAARQDTDETDNEIDLIKTQIEILGEQINDFAAEGIRAPETTRRKLHDLQTRLSQLEESHAQRQGSLVDLDEIRRLAQAIGTDPGHTIATLPVEQKTRVFNLLLEDVRIAVYGRGVSTQHVIVHFTSKIGGYTWHHPEFTPGCSTNITGLTFVPLQDRIERYQQQADMRVVEQRQDGRPTRRRKNPVVLRTDPILPWEAFPESKVFGEGLPACSSDKLLWRFVSLMAA